MSYDPGTLLVAKPAVLTSKVPLFKTYSMSAYYQWYRHAIREEDNPKDFQPGDNIFIIDHYCVEYKAHEPKYSREDWFYRVWVNGQEAKLQCVVLEIKEYYEVVK